MSIYFSSVRHRAVLRLAERRKHQEQEKSLESFGCPTNCVRTCRGCFMKSKHHSEDHLCCHVSGIFRHMEPCGYLLEIMIVGANLQQNQKNIHYPSHKTILCSSNVPKMISSDSLSGLSREDPGHALWSLRTLHNVRRGSIVSQLLVGYFSCPLQKMKKSFNISSVLQAFTYKTPMRARVTCG